MLNGYIKIEDIEKILNNIEQTEGYINKQTFQLAITRLKEHRKPKEKKKIIFKRTTARDMISNIIRYQNSIKSDKKKGDLYKFFETVIIDLGENIYNEDIAFYKAKTFGVEKNKFTIIKNDRTILTNDKLAKVLNITRKKLTTLKKNNIVKSERYTKIHLYYKGNIIATEYYKDFYDIDIIRKNLKNLL